MSNTVYDYIPEESFESISSDILEDLWKDEEDLWDDFYEKSQTE